MKPVILYQCDEFKSTSSFGYGEPYTNMKALRTRLRYMLKWGEIEIQPGANINKSFRNCDIDDINKGVVYAYIDEPELNRLC